MATLAPTTQPRPALGLMLCLAVALAGMALGQLPWLQAHGLGALTLAIITGIVLGNTVFPRWAAAIGSGVDIGKGRLLRWGIVLYGFRVSLADIVAVGPTGLAIDALMLASVFLLAVWVGTRWLKLDRDTAMLIGAGSAICGAAAVLATEPVLRAPAHKVSVAVATVVVFGTVAMFLYPLLYPLMGISAHGYGLYVGSTVHEVAQVVVAGQAIGSDAGHVAVIEKMLRVMLLAPFLMLLSAWLTRGTAQPGGHAGRRISVPWFALGFIAVSAFNSLSWLPSTTLAWINLLDTVLLATAMAGLGLRTSLDAIRQAGVRPLLLAAVLFGWLLVGGFAVNQTLQALLAG
ncbi:YeiH family protein [Pseudoxanthomonas dokdonensis]|uniref:Membrane protein n=1 Tax=Pseudoxanthomonas dokdonensis TaxID=344882 RepID=A0A0R0CXB1_9GAMM|nr:YeiH family protein [Pseudoxanthomonas dokdonensis]KRG70702.1 membrane protein [Pseudoxanthomonas dokdonensis]